MEIHKLKAFSARNNAVLASYFRASAFYQATRYIREGEVVCSNVNFFTFSMECIYFSIHECPQDNVRERLQAEN